MKAIRMYEFGGSDVLKYEYCPDQTLAAGQAFVTIQDVGVNFADVSARGGGAVPPPALPEPPGFEVAGVVPALGEGVRDLKVGDTVAYWGVRGPYAEMAVVSA